MRPGQKWREEQVHDTTRIQTAVVAVLCLGLLVGCGDANGDYDPAAQPQVSDSAGVVLVNLPHGFQGLGLSDADLRRITRIGREGSAIELYRVASARFLPSGELAIANSGTGEILVVTAEGDLISRFGGLGEGPGEFSVITSLHVREDGSLVAYDDRQGRLTAFSADGELLGTRKLTDPSPIADLIPVLASMDGPVLAVYGDNRSFGNNEIRQDTTPLFRFTPESTIPDTVGMWAGKAWSFQAVSAGMSRVQLAFGPDLLHSGHGDWAALAETHAPLVRVYSPSGEATMQIVWHEVGRPVTDEDYEDWQDDRRADMGDYPEEIQEQFAAAPRFDTHPLIDGILVGSDGSIWVAPTALGGRQWVRFASNGDLLSSLQIPRNAEALHYHAGRLAVLEKDRLDVETVVIYEIQEPSGR